LERLVEQKYLACQPAALNAVFYEITDLGRATIIGVG
jgi:hypothetical protein